MLNIAVFHEKSSLYTLLKFPIQKPIKRGGLIWLEEIGRGGEVGGAAKLPLKRSFKDGPSKTNGFKPYMNTHIFNMSTSCPIWHPPNIAG